MSRLFRYTSGKQIQSSIKAEGLKILIARAKDKLEHDLDDFFDDLDRKTVHSSNLLVAVDGVLLCSN